MAKRKKKVGSKVKTGGKNIKSTPRKRKSSPQLFERIDLHFWQRDIRLTQQQSNILKLGGLGLFIVMALLSIRVGLNGDDDVQANY